MSAGGRIRRISNQSGWSWEAKTPQASSFHVFFARNMCVAAMSVCLATTILVGKLAWAVFIITKCRYDMYMNMRHIIQCF